MNSSLVRKIDATTGALAARPRLTRGYAALAASAAVGVVVGIIATTQGSPGLAVGAVVAVPVGVAAAMTLAGVTRGIAAVLVALAASYGFVVHHSPDVTIFELVAIVPAAWLVATNAGAIVSLARREPVAWTFAIASVALVVLGAFYFFWQPAHLGLGVQRKEFGKNVEIVALTLAVLGYVDRPTKFRRAYAALALFMFVGSLRPVVNYGGHVFHTETLQTQEPLAFLLLALPFARRLPVAFLLGAAAVLLIVTRTRSAWIVALAALAVLGIRGWRRRSGRGVAVISVACAVALVAAVFAVPSTRARLDSLASGHDESVETRLQMLNAAAVEVGRFPFAGVGPGHFKDWLVTHQEAAPSIAIGVTQIPRDPHNTLAKFASEMGIPGLVLFLLWVVAALAAPWVAWRRWRRAPPRPDMRGRRELADLRAYLVGIWLYAPLFLLLVVISEWGTVGRVEIALAAGLFLSLLRVIPRTVAAEAQA